MTRLPVPAPRRDAQGRITYVDALLDTEPRQVIRGEIVRTDHVPPIGWVPVTDPTTPVFNELERYIVTHPECDPASHCGGWNGMVTASRATSAAYRTRFLVTMAGTR